jgi:formylglycine-generating enzyme required for sulfatase activity
MAWTRQPQTSPVGQSRPNAWGIYDMHGNAWEWCLDWYDRNYYENSPIKNPKGPDSGELKVVRGGVWEKGPRYARSAERDAVEPTHTASKSGFRVIMQPGS